jgi:hypothetical protein
VVLRWARLTDEMNGGGEGLGQYASLLLSSPSQERDTSEVRQLFASPSAAVLPCVWTGHPIRSGNLHIDHVVPHSVWGNNDLWNLLPCDAPVNLAKSDALPPPGLIRKRQDSIVGCWRLYHSHFGSCFDRQIERGLGCSVDRIGWEEAALAGLTETVVRLSARRGLPSWEPV